MIEKSWLKKLLDGYFFGGVGGGGNPLMDNSFLGKVLYYGADSMKVISTDYFVKSGHVDGVEENTIWIFDEGQFFYGDLILRLEGGEPDLHYFVDRYQVTVGYAGMNFEVFLSCKDRQEVVLRNVPIELVVVNKGGICGSEVVSFAFYGVRVYTESI